LRKVLAKVVISAACKLNGVTVFGAAESELWMLKKFLPGA
jgi:hypothetical protein